MTKEELKNLRNENRDKSCANCREWFINGIGERDCLQIHCEDYSDWVERPESSEVEK